MTIPFHTTDWSGIEKTVYPGNEGSATWQVLSFPGLRIRKVEYSKGYIADHWCRKGHLLFCLEGELLTVLKDGTSFLLKQNMSYQVSDELSEHRSSTTAGARLLIIDGDFLKLEK